METTLQHFGPSVSNDALNFFLGDHIATGQYRTVYDYYLNPSWVVKVEKASRAFSNIMEWETWTNLKDTPLQKWLCPVVGISPFGSTLVMFKAEPIQKLPRRVPSIFADIKLDNWGTLDGRPVCIDYGNHSFFSLALKHWKMKEAK